MSDCTRVFSIASNVQQVHEAVEANNELRDTESIRVDLDECLSNIQPSGSFSVSETLVNPPNPGIFLANGGGIGLPLSDRDADAFIAASHQAPFGKGEQTLVDTSVRKTWEISASEFELRNPAWEQFLKSIVKKVSAGLGVDTTGKGVSAQLYKMLMYDEGAMFKAHQDSEKTPGMFGTLVIALPSEHEGGEVRVTHAGQTQILKTAPSSKFDSSYLAWFSDVTHEVKPVLSGRRLVLTYNLVHVTLGPTELAANTNKTIAKLRPLLPEWRESSREEERESALAYLLKHEYTESSLRYDSLKGYDQQVVSHLLQVCNEFDFCVYLASIRRTVTGQRDGDEYGHTSGDIDYVDEDKTKLTKVFDLNGQELAESLDFNKDCFMSLDPFDGLEADDEENEYTGNEGVSATLFYEKTVVLIMPRESRVEFFFPPKRYKKNPYGRVVEIEDGVDRTPKMVTLTNQLVLESSQNVEDVKIHNDLLLLTGRLSTEIPNTPKFSDRLALIEGLQLGKQDINTKNLALQTYQKWLEGLTDSTLSNVSMSMETAKDGTALASLCKSILPQKIFTHVLPAVKRNCFNPAMAMAFLTGLVDAAASGNIPTNILNSVFNDVISDVSECFSLRNIIPTVVKKETAKTYGWRSNQVVPVEPDLENGHNIAAVLSHCHKFSLDGELEKIVTKLVDEARFAVADRFEELYLPILQAVTIIHPPGSLGPETTFSRLFQQLLAVYISNFVKEEPQYPQEWTRPTLKCPCHSCQALNPFLANPGATQYFMRGQHDKRNHVKTELGKGFQFEIDKTTKPQSMVITKTADEYIRNHAAWVNRCAQAKQHIAKLGTDHLTLYLGSMYDAIINVWVPNIQTFLQSIGGNASALAPLSTGAVNNASNRTLPPITKRKVPNQVIIIDDSD